MRPSCVDHSRSSDCCRVLDVRSARIMSADHHRRCLNLIQLSEATVYHTDNTMVSLPQGFISRIWRRRRLTKMQAPYEQFILFGDSITQDAHNQSNGFAFGAALQNGTGY